MVTAMLGANYREDELQAERCEEIIQLLVVAGYFRARIKGLSNFDKVVGGLVWCVQVCAVDIEVDLLFNENWNIGRKIALTEAIVRALKDMKCPHPIEPHQIQGNDYVHVFPVVQWLVKKALETREHTARYNAAFARYQLEKNFGILPPLPKSIQLYKPVRAYRHNAPESLTRDILLDSVLLEYSAHKSDDDCLQSSSILSDMQSVEKKPETSGDDSNKKMKQLVERREKEIEEGVEEWRELRGDDDIHSRRKDRVLKEIFWREKRIGELRETVKERKDKVESARQRAKQASAELVVMREIVEVEGFPKVCELLQIVDEMKRQESEFKKACRREIKELEQLVAEEERKVAGDDQLDQVDDKVEEEFAQVAQMKIKIAKLNRQVAKLQRAIDQIPTRSELAQFQRRFVELHQQVADVHKETKQYYTMYNTMNDLCAYLDKEISLVNSIQDNFTQAMSSSSSREMFLKQVDASLQGIRQNRVKTERRRLEAKMERDKLQYEYLRLIEQQRLYVKMVADFKEELRRNQTLMASKSLQPVGE